MRMIQQEGRKMAIFGQWLPSWVGIVVVLLLSYGLMMSSAVRKSGTVDEAPHIHRGLAYLREGATQFRLGHPVTGHAIASLGALLERDVVFPVDDPSWAEGQWGVAGSIFMWESGHNAQRLLFLGRLVGIWSALLLGAVVYRWGADWVGGWAGVAAAVLVALDPNVIAHARMVTNDVPVAFCFVLCVYGFWRWSRDPQWRFIVLAGVALGLGGSIKYTSAVLVPIVGVLALFLAVRRESWRPIGAALGIGLVAWLFIWAIFGFAMRPLPGGLFWEDLLWQLQYVGGEHGVYLNGEIRTTGWWYYFPVAFLVKTPLPMLLFLGMGLVWIVFLGVGRRYRLDDWMFVLVPPLVYFAFTQATAINIGYRYLISAVPFVVLGGVTILGDGRVGKRHAFSLRAGMWGLVVATAVVSVVIWPNYLSHFSLIAGGQDEGWRVLSDSNVDWGQDLIALREWQLETGHDDLKLSYFGTAFPSAYGLEFEPLPTWEPGPEQQRPDRQAFYPLNPAPGFYAISVTNLHGAVLGERPEMYAYFLEMEPVFKAGNSIFVYEVVAENQLTVDVAFSGVVPMDVGEEIYEVLGTNDVRVRWFDVGESFVFFDTDKEGTRFVVLDEMMEGWDVGGELVEVIEGVYLYELVGGSQSSVASSQMVMGGVGFAGVEDVGVCGEVVRLVTVWEVLAETDQSLKVFVHGLNGAGEIVGQSDVLDVDSLTWLPGDEVWQRHGFGVSERPMALRVGLYDGGTGERMGEPVVIEIDELGDVDGDC